MADTPEAAAATTDPAAQPFRVGGVLGRGFTLVFRHIVPFGATALIIFLPIGAIAAVITLVPLDANTLIWLVVATLLAVFLLAYVATAGISYGTFQALRGEKPRLGACLTKGFSVVFPVLGVALLTMLALAASLLPGVLIGSLGGTGFLALMIFLSLIPLLMVLTMLWVSIPACVVERPGVLGSLGRSARLTKGERWRVFGIVVIVMLVNWGISLLSNVITVPLATADPSAATMAIVGGAVGLITTAFYTALNAVMAAVAYHDLRVAKEGIGIDQIAAVFD
jgi:hypothetical protein